MKKGLTELVFILDSSGSMCGSTEDTIGGYNSMLERQKKVEGEAYVTTVLFSSEQHTITDRVDIHEVEPMTAETYRARGNTALLDALGDTISRIKTIHQYAREEDRPEHTVFVITTDGMENASRRWTLG